MNTRKSIIKSLENLAAEVLDLKEKYRQRRPIIIEFSGSPKSGKTSCISALLIFLKRNGFTVRVIQERASVCPVADKKSPMFNVWTSCTAIAEMIGYLESDEIICDVLILDRGIFDSLCWFTWLYKKNKMRETQKSTIEKFLLMPEFSGLIDIVYVFYSNTDISIQREYANLLTDKPGSIMNKKVLSEYYKAVMSTIDSKKHFYQRIEQIDTSDKNQNDVGKEITKKTLDILRELLMERVGYIRLSESLLYELKKARFTSFNDFSKKDDLNMQFDLRSDVENSNDKIQPIPIAVITNKERNRVFVFKKNEKAVSKDSPERDKLLLYVGGHTRAEDMNTHNSNDFLSLCRTTLVREIKEELGYSVSFDGIDPYIIYTPDSDKSKKHIGICFILETDIDEIKIRLDPHELTLNRGKSKSGKHLSIYDIIPQEYESWSVEILNGYFEFNVVQTSLLDNSLEI